MKQIIIRMFVALTMCAVTSVIRFTSFIVISGRLQVHAESVWILRLIRQAHSRLVYPSKA